MFGTSGIRGPIGETVTAGLAVELGVALGRWGADRIVVGRDVRSHGEYLAAALGCGARQCGVDVVDVGVCSTPTIARAVGWRNADAGVAVTASHNPPTDNGFKFWLPSGQGFPAEDRARIERALVEDATEETVSWDTVGSRSHWDGAADRHVAAIAGAVEGGAALSVVVDVGNGTGGITAQALDRLGCDVTTIHGRTDGTFPGRPSEPTAENCRKLQRIVPALEADLGIAHDGDADRMRAVDATGRFLAGDTLLTLFATRTASPGDRVVAPVDASLAVEDVLTARDVDLVRAPVGDVHVAEAIAEHDAVFGGEPSGAWIWPGAARCPDGPLAACRLVGIVDREGPLSELVAGMDRYPLRRGAIDADDTDRTMSAIERTVRDRYEDVGTLDGLRVTTTNGWFLLRPSGTEPLIRVTAEARDADETDRLFAEARGIVTGAMDEIDQMI